MVKTWEMEVSHKVKFDQWQTVDTKNYKIQANGGKVFENEDMLKGTYNTLLAQCPRYQKRKGPFTHSIENAVIEASSNFSMKLR